MILQLLLHILSWILFVYLSIGTLFLLLMAVAGIAGKKRSFGVHDKKKSILVLIPSYREDAIIVDTAIRARSHDYPANRFHVMVIADKLQPSTVEALRSIPVEVLPVDENMKSRSIHRALSALENPGFDIVMLLDADNIMKEGCLQQVNDAFHLGYRAVQCHRTAKNKQTPVALLDAISEEININLFRRGPSRLGLSAAPIGSGMAFEQPLLEAIFSAPAILNNPGEDREIDMQLLKRGIKMEFLDHAYVLDEKVSTAAVFERQRVRWLEAQVSHVKRFFDEDMKGMPRRESYYVKFFQNLLLPRILTLFLFALIIVLLFAQWLFRGDWWRPAPQWWFACMALYAFSLVISVPASFYNKATLRALSHVPLLLFSMLKAVSKMKKERKEFLHTPKSYTPD